MKIFNYFIILVLFQTFLISEGSCQSKYFFEIRDGENNEIVKDATIKVPETSKMTIETNNNIFSFEKIKKNDIISISKEEYVNLKLNKNNFKTKEDTITFYLIPSEEELTKRWERNKTNTYSSIKRDTIYIQNLELLKELVDSRFMLNEAISYYCGQNLCNSSNTYKFLISFKHENKDTFIATEYKDFKPELNCLFLNNYLDDFILYFPIVIIEDLDSIKSETTSILIPITIRFI